MSKNIIEILIKGKDQASAAFAKVEGSAASTTNAVTMSNAALALGAIAAAAAVKKLTDSATELNVELANIGTLIPGNIGRLNELKETVNNMSVEMNRDAVDLAQGSYQLVSALGDTADTVDILKLSAKAATAGISTTTEAINLLTAVTKGYGDTSKESFQHVADLAFTTVRLGQTTFPELAQSMRRVIPVAAAMNVEQEELFAAYATLTGVTGDATLVSTQLFSILNGLIKPTDALKAAVKKLGYQNTETLITEKGLVGGLREVIATTDGTKEALGELFRNARGLPGLFALIGGQAEVFDQKFASMRDTTEALNIAFNEQVAGINKYAVEIEKTGRVATNAGRNLGDSFLPALGNIAEALRPGIKGLELWTDGISRFVEWSSRGETAALKFARWIGDSFSDKVVEDIRNVNNGLYVSQGLIEDISLAAGKTTQPERGYGDEKKYVQHDAHVQQWQDANDLRDVMLQAETEVMDAIVLKVKARERETAEIKEQAALLQRMKNLDSELDLGIALAEGHEKKVKDIVNPFADEWAESQKEMSRDFDQWTEGLVRGFGSAIGEMIVGARSFGDAMRALFASMAPMMMLSLGKQLFKVAPALLSDGGEYVGGYSGLEVSGGTWHRDTVPAMIAKGEVVTPSPTVERLNDFLDGAGVGGDTIIMRPVFFHGGRRERAAAGHYIKDRQEKHSKFIVKGGL